MNDPNVPSEIKTGTDNAMREGSKFGVSLLVMDRPVSSREELRS